jgi:hypothetical protein
MVGAPTQMEQHKMTEAHYTTGKQPLLDITHRFSDGARVVVKTIAVTGKREARKLAAQYNATPWNF